MEVKRVKDRKGTYGLYDATGEFVGTVCTSTGRAMIGNAFWERAGSGFVDRRAIFMVAEEMREARPHDSDEASFLIEDWERRLRSAIGGFTHADR